MPWGCRIHSHRFTVEQLFLGGDLQDKNKHLLADRRRQSLASLRQARMIGSAVADRNSWKLLQRKAVRTSPRNAPLRTNVFCKSQKTSTCVCSAPPWVDRSQIDIPRTRSKAF